LAAFFSGGYFYFSGGFFYFSSGWWWLFWNLYIIFTDFFLIPFGPVFVYRLTTNLIGACFDLDPSTGAYVRLSNHVGSKLELGWSLCLLGVDDVLRRAGGKILFDACLPFAADFVFEACIPCEFGRALGEEADVL
jgi:hypothetical protein